MHVKNFEHVVHFQEVPNPNGDSKYYPLVQVTIITSTSSRISLSLLFDTGADITTLRSDLYAVLGLNSWDQGQQVQVQGVGGAAGVYQYTATLEIFGKTINCPVHLAPMQPNPFFSGLLGRNTIFKEFGFGFWENTKELFYTENP